MYEKYAPHPVQEETDIDEGELSELSREELDKAAQLIDDFKTDEAADQIKKWLLSPLKKDMKQLLTDVLAAVEDEFDEDKAVSLLKKYGEDKKL